MTILTSPRTWPNGKKKMKTNKEKNLEHEKRELMRVRPKQPAYEFEELTKIVNGWVRERVNTQHE